MVHTNGGSDPSSNDTYSHTPNTSIYATNNEKFPTLIKISQPFISHEQILELLDRNGTTLMHFNESKSECFRMIMYTATHFKFPIQTICTAMVTFQYFYLFNKISNYNPVEVVCACVFVASKIQDTPKKSKEIISLVFSLKGVAFSQDQLKEKQNVILKIERDIFETIGFDFRSNSVQHILIKLCKDLGVDEPTAKIAWTISVDALLSNIYLQIPSHTIALACIILACNLNGINGIFPIESAIYHSTRYKANAALCIICELYMSNFSERMELTNSPNWLEYRDQFSGLYNICSEEMDRFVRKHRNIKQNMLHHRAVSQRDKELSRKGAVRYVLEWERDRDSGELTTHVDMTLQNRHNLVVDSEELENVFLNDPKLFDSRNGNKKARIS